MTSYVAIGDFSRLTHLSVKTLHHYHDVGLLEPASVDATTGYRRYELVQVGEAHLIRRLRDLDMPVPQVRTLLTAPDIATRSAILRAHLERMEAELARTQDVVASLRRLLEPASLDVEHRTIPAQLVLAVGDIVPHEAIAEWCGTAFGRLCGAAAQAGIEVVGPPGGTYSREFFEQDRGEVIGYVPVPAGTIAPPGLQARELAGGRFAVAVHAGAFEDSDRTYGALGSHVIERDLADVATKSEPIRELYAVGPDDTDDPAEFRTEVCWPIRADTIIG